MCRHMLSALATMSPDAIFPEAATNWYRNLSYLVNEALERFEESSASTLPTRPMSRLCSRDALEEHGKRPSSARKTLYLMQPSPGLHRCGVATHSSFGVIGILVPPYSTLRVWTDFRVIHLAKSVILLLRFGSIRTGQGAAASWHWQTEGRQRPGCGWH
eukprot:2051676-Amphidinium_carterae.1